MKFGKTLLRNQVVEWADHYIDYKRLKKLVARAVARRKRLGVHVLPADDPDRVAFFRGLEDEVQKMNAFFIAQLPLTSARCRGLAVQHSVLSTKITSSPTSPQQENTHGFPWHDTRAGPAGGLPSPPVNSSPAALDSDGTSDDPSCSAIGRNEHESVLDEALDLKDEVDALAAYQRINMEGVRKILKKYDKRLKEQSQSGFFSNKVAGLPLASTEALQPIEALIANIVKGAHASVEDGKGRVCEWKTYSF